jgi:hypothetical protein
MTGKTRNLAAAVAASMVIGLALAAGAPRAAPQPEGQPGGSPATGQATDPAMNPWTSAQPPKTSGGKGGTRREAQAEAIEAAAAQAATTQADPQVQRHRAKRAAKKAAEAPSSASTTSPGDDAFGAIAEVVRKLEDDPNTDWSKVDLEALRQHLIDMNEVTLNAMAVAKPIEGGLKITVTGTGRTVAAIQRMVPAHAKEIDGLKGWAVKAQLIPRGALLQVTSSDADQVKHIRGLGFIGIMVTGGHHAEHHLVMAKGGAAHKH